MVITTSELDKPKQHGKEALSVTFPRFCKEQAFETTGVESLVHVQSHDVVVVLYEVLAKVI
jgi:hypothetical protein